MSARKVHQTPTRLTRSRAATPLLPALQTRQSHAYGAAGKASLGTQITTSNADVDEAFAASVKSVERPQRGRKAQKETLAAAEPASNDDTTEGSDGRPDTALQDSAVYARASRAQMPPPPRPPPPPQQQAARSQPPPPPPPPPPNGPIYEPPRLRIFLRTALQMIVPAIQYLLIFCFFFFLSCGVLSLLLNIYAFAPLPDNMDPAREMFIRGLKGAIGVPGYDQPPNSVETLWAHFRHTKMYQADFPQAETTLANQWFVNRHLLGRIEDRDSIVSELQEKSGLHSESIQALEQLLPHSLAMTQDGDGNWQIPQLFWQALLDKMQNDGSAIWDSFLEQNRHGLDEFNKDIFKEEFDQMSNLGRVVSKEIFQSYVQENNEIMEKKFATLIGDIREQMLLDAKSAARETTEQLIGNSQPGQTARMQFSSLAYSNLFYNMDKKMREKNYFSLGMGAVIDPRLTSVTHGSSTFVRRLAEWLMWRAGLGSFYVPQPYPNHPSTALTDWNEATECWCASFTGDELHKGQRGQITIQTPFQLLPEQLVVEHIPASGTRDIAAAPRKFEFWGRVSSPEAVERIHEELYYPEGSRYLTPCGEPPNDGGHWACLTSREYDIHGSNYVQTFRLFTATSGVDDIVLDKFAFRAVENWGAEDHTCIYRLRLVASEVGFADFVDFKPAHKN